MDLAISRNHHRRLSPKSLRNMLKRASKRLVNHPMKSKPLWKFMFSMLCTIRALLSSEYLLQDCPHTIPEECSGKPVASSACYGSSISQGGT